MAQAEKIGRGDAEIAEDDARSSITPCLLTCGCAYELGRFLVETFPGITLPSPRLGFHAPTTKHSDQSISPRLQCIYQHLQPLARVAESTGLEPATSAVTGRRSNRLS
jgi:hypothetical protein